jgi:hypothetical protein
MIAEKESPLKGTTNEEDAAEFNECLEESKGADLTDLERSGCVSTGRDNKNHHIVIMIPSLGLNSTEKPQVMFRRMLLLFIKQANDFVGHSYSVVYAHTDIDIMNQYPLIYKFYSILPRSYKKNLQKMYIIHPNVGIKMFFEFARVFLSHKFYSKLLLLETILDFQRVVPPTQLSLPLRFIHKEDEENGLKYYNRFASLRDSFIPSIGTTKLLEICSQFILHHGGATQVGIFRVAGDEIELIVAKTRLQYSCVNAQNSNRIILSENKDFIIVGDIDSITNFKASASNAGARASMAIRRSSISLKATSTSSSKGTTEGTHSSSSAAAHLLPDEVPTSSIIIRDVNTVAQIFKMAIRDLPEPLVTHDVYRKLVDTHKKYNVRIDSNNHVSIDETD